jgi:hypothetical protein
MCLGPLGYFFKLSENSKGPWISKNLNRSFIKRFQKKTLEGILGPTLGPPLLQNHYPIQPLAGPPPPPSLINFEKKSSTEIYGAVTLHIKIKMDNFFLVIIFEKKKWKKFLVPFPIDEITTLKPFVQKNEKRIMFFFLLIF